MDILLLPIIRISFSWTCLGFNPYFNGHTTFTVSIIFVIVFLIICFNPYFNGHTTFTLLEMQLEILDKCVSILILMDILLLLSIVLWKGGRWIHVSILILMDILLLHLENCVSMLDTFICFNPYFNGHTTFTLLSFFLIKDSSLRFQSLF